MRAWTNKLVAVLYTVCAQDFQRQADHALSALIEENENMFLDQLEEEYSSPLLQALQTIAFGGMCVGTLDGFAAIINAGIKGVSPDKVFHYIASGLIGRDASYNGGPGTVMLGIVMHYAIAFGVVAVFFLLSRSFPSLLRRPVISGMFYGVAVYFAMAYLIVPLSAVPRIPFSFAGMITSIVIHILCVGLPTALITRSMSRE